MKILAYAEQRDGKFKKVAYEVVHAAHQAASQLGAELAALVVGKEVEGIAPELGAYGTKKVYVVQDDRLHYYSSTAYAKAVAAAVESTGSDILFLPATAMGKDLAARLSAKLGAGLAADCTQLRYDGGEIIATRPVYAGKALVDVRVNSTRKIFTLRPNVFSAGNPAMEKAAVEKVNVPLEDSDFASKVTSISTAKAGRPDLTEADIIISGGRGLGGPENFKMIEELADLLGAGVGASRAAVDAGWRPHEDQVGQTGKTVSPSLYVAVAISGAIQHLAGMSSSKYIVAINKDKEAPIFQVADYGIVGDAFEIVPELTLQLKKALGKE
jgi:electron transfer flavoprotein alpha subunit